MKKKVTIGFALLTMLLCAAGATNDVDAINQVMDNEDVEISSITQRDDIVSYSESEIEARGIYKYRVIGNGVRVRAAAGLSGTPIGQMNWGDVCYSAKPDDGGSDRRYVDGMYWQYVVCGAPLTGQEGWIAEQYLREERD